MASTRQFTLALALALSLSGVSLLQGCAGYSDPGSAGAAAADAEFMAWNEKLTDEILADPKYNRMPIDTDEQALEYEAKLHQAYRHQISTREFTDWLNKTYPGHSYEIEFVTSRLPK